MVVTVRVREDVVPTLAPVPELLLGLLEELELSLHVTEASAALKNVDTRLVLTLLSAVPPTESLMDNGVTKEHLTGVSIATMLPEVGS